MSRSQQELVSAVRELVQNLASPALHVFAALQQAENLAVTQLTVPLVDFSPFTELVVPAPPHSDHITAQRQRLTTAESPFTATKQAEEEQAIGKMATDEQPPLFSFRTRAAQQRTRSDTKEKVSTFRNDSSRVGNLHAQSPETEERSRTPRQREDNSNALINESLPEAHPSSHARSNEQLAGTNLGPSAGAELASRYADPNALVAPTLPSLMSAPASTAFAETRSKEEFTITEIAKTAEQLLRTATDSPFTSRTQANTHPKATMAPLSSQNQGMKTRVVLPFGGNNSSDEPSREGITSTSDLGASSSPPFVQAAIAAEEVAALVNEILIEQARRHGVDLS